MTVRALSLLTGVVALVAGCGGGTSKAEDDGPFTVAISEDARQVSQNSGVDLDRLVTDSAAKVFTLLPHVGRIRIDVQLDASRSIPEVGVGGYTDPKNGNVSLDRRQSAGRAGHVLQTWVPATLAHELHHSSRIRTGPGYGMTLGEALVTEGLADHFVDEAFPTTPPQPWDKALTEEQEHALWQRAEPELWRAYDHRLWFFGDSGIPRWAGYSLGYSIVQRFLDEGRSAAGSVEVPAKTVVRSYARRS